jgi:hypothetical protein
MTAPTGQLTEITQRGQEAVTTAVRLWTDALTNYTKIWTSAQNTQSDAQIIVDSVFGFAESVLASQREFITGVITVRSQVATAAPAGPHGEGSHAPLANASEAPDGFPIKGNDGSRLYHVPGSTFFDRAVAEVWFATPEAAEAAGYQLPKSQR